MTTRKMTTTEADEMARQFARANDIDLMLVPGLRPWVSLEAHLNPPNLHGHHPEARAIRSLAAKWAAFLRHNGFKR